MRFPHILNDIIDIFQFLWSNFSLKLHNMHNLAVRITYISQCGARLSWQRIWWSQLVLPVKCRCSTSNEARTISFHILSNSCISYCHSLLHGLNFWQCSYMCTKWQFLVLRLERCSRLPSLGGSFVFRKIFHISVSPLILSTERQPTS
jgi:hypothetical protein